MRGGWVRNGLGLDGAEPTEDAVVWWLQASSKHCDLRIPHLGDGGLKAFAGTTTWADPRLTWHPELELNPNFSEDIGVITWDGVDLMETGTFTEDGRETTYVERWQRLPGSGGDSYALSSDTGRIVRTGSYALTIIDRRKHGGPFAALAWTSTGHAWSVAHRWPADAVAPPPPLELSVDADSVRLEDGTDWVIDER